MIAWLALAAHAEPDLQAAEALWSGLASVQHLRAEFTQVQRRKLLKAPLTSTGVLAFERPDKLRWEVTGGASSVFVVSGTEVSAKMPGVDQVARIDLATQPQLAGLVSGLTVWLAADAEALQSQYEIELPEDHVAVLRPKDPVLQKALSTLTVHVDPSGRYLSSVELLEPDGDAMTITLTSVDLESTLPATTFTID
ncbi:MAG: outer membrane lipoprotein carrier protein LolA [Alphaproteobacteria bacterium]|nr:outer membrane lipoprotein carrier protein LolA [Myxococcales bacterium]MCB9697304.1 outer membrane lipoprotein carrier protein LolA [Alphaproteobacteria bacterium]